MGRSTSWGWKGILQGQKILKGGLRWRIGDWRSIRIVKDPWLPTPHTFLPISQSGDMSLMVGDLVGVGRLWNKYIIERCFNEEEDGINLSMPISKFGCPDQIIWHYTWKRMYSIKFGYMVAQEMNRNGEFGRKGVGQSSEDHVKDPIWGLYGNLRFLLSFIILFGRAVKTFSL
ncbi:hypothetical protein ACFX11_028590 [Malus domestica]